MALDWVHGCEECEGCAGCGAVCRCTGARVRCAGAGVHGCGGRVHRCAGAVHGCGARVRCMSAQGTTVHGCYDPCVNRLGWLMAGAGSGADGGRRADLQRRSAGRAVRRRTCHGRAVARCPTRHRPRARSRSADVRRSGAPDNAAGGASPARVASPALCADRARSHDRHGWPSRATSTGPGVSRSSVPRDRARDESRRLTRVASTERLRAGLRPDRADHRCGGRFAGDCDQLRKGDTP